MVIARTPIVGRPILIVSRFRTAIRYFRNPLLNLVKWLFKSNEVTNYTYDLEEKNRRYLASLIADIANIEFSVAMAYFNEIEGHFEQCVF